MTTTMNLPRLAIVAAQQEPAPEHEHLTPNGFGGTIAQLRLTFIIIAPVTGLSRLYVFHGTTACDNWHKVADPLATGKIQELRQMIDRLVGVTGAHRAFRMLMEVNY